MRVLAALAVFLTHLSRQHMSGGVLWQVAPYGDEAVIVFFVLSGFVIAFATDMREHSGRDYAINRMARIFSVALPATVIVVVLDWIGVHLRPDLYNASWGFADDVSLFRIFSALSFSNEFWMQHVTQGSNPPYWSLGYEVPYYLIYGLALFAPVRYRYWAVAGAAAMVGPAILALLPAWLAGVAAYRLGKRDLLSENAGIALFILAAAVWAAYETIAWKIGRSALPGMPWLKRGTLIQDYLVGGCFAAIVVGFSAAANRVGGPLRRHCGRLRWLANRSFTLYLLHFPIAKFLQIHSLWPRGGYRHWSFLFAGTLVVVFLIAEVTENRKATWRRAISWLWDRAAGLGQAARNAN